MDLHILTNFDRRYWFLYIIKKLYLSSANLFDKERKTMALWIICGTVDSELSSVLFDKFRETNYVT